MKRFIIILLCVLFMATSCQLFKPTPQEKGMKVLNVEDRYLTQEEMGELVTFVWKNGDKSEEVGRYFTSAYEMSIEEDGEVLIKTALVYIYDIQDKYYFADQTTSEVPFITLVIINKPETKEYKNDNGDVIALQVEIVYEFYSSMYDEAKNGYGVKPNKIFSKKVVFEGYTGGIVSQELLYTKEYNNEGYDDDNWKTWLSLFYEKIQIDKNTVEEDGAQ